MARVHLSGELRRLADGEALVEIEADTVGRLLKVLEDRYPELGRRVRAGAAVVLDGEVTPNAEYLPVEPETDVHFVIPVGGG